MTIHRLPPPFPSSNQSTGDNARPLSLVEILTAPQRILELPLEVIPPLLCQLSALQNALAARLLQTQVHANDSEEADPTDQLLTPSQAAAMMGVTKRWIYRHAPRLPFTKRLSNKTLRFSQRGLKQWLQRRRA